MTLFFTSLTVIQSEIYMKFNVFAVFVVVFVVVVLFKEKRHTHGTSVLVILFSMAMICYSNFIINLYWIAVVYYQQD